MSLCCVMFLTIHFLVSCIVLTNYFNFELFIEFLKLNFCNCLKCIQCESILSMFSKQFRELVGMAHFSLNNCLDLSP